ncbi:MAG TPA: L-fucose/L-arabinose isomerase family protein [Verrucomicrobiae bacterium]|nr:L-fucose/L-arabinose isomerase family protein [Verrucomicrobiae bacterium]
MARIGILTLGDGRPDVMTHLTAHAEGELGRLVTWLAGQGHELRSGRSVITSNTLATTEARHIAAFNPDVVILQYPIWAFPHFSVLAAAALPVPLILLGALDGRQPGMVGMLAAGGALDQIGRVHLRAWGDVADPSLAARLGEEIAAAVAVSRVRGSTFGRVGGRPMGMYTAVASAEVWMRDFGIDVEEIDQGELVRCAQEVDPARVTQARRWLEAHAAQVAYDGRALTPELLERQIRSYYAMRGLIDEWHLDFSGIKAQPELTTHYATMDIAEAFLNDPYDWDGPKSTHVCATESDMDGALTMQVLKLITGLPVLFADVRHYHAELGVWDLCNSGQHATWYAERSSDPLVNLASTHLLPEVFFFPAGGAAVHHVAAPGDCTFARLSRLGGRYRLQVVTGAIERYDDATNQRLMQATTYAWPHAFARLDVDAAGFLERFGANHIHAVPGDRRPSLRAYAHLLGIDYVDLASPR